MNFFEKLIRFLKDGLVPGLSRDKVKGDYLLILDIGTEFVKSLILKVDRKLKTGTIVGVGYEKQPAGNMQAGAVADIAGVIENCQKAVRKAKITAGIHRTSLASQAILGIAGEFVRGAVTSLDYERENPNAKIDLTEFKNIIQKIQWRAFNKIRQEAAEEVGISEIEIKLINAAIVDVKIDGYKVTNPLNFQGKQLTLSIFNAYAPLVHLGALQSITKVLGLELLFVAAEPYAIARAIKFDKNSDRGDAIFIDMGGGTTDIAVVRQGGIDGIKSLALGGKAFTKRLARFFDLGLQEAEELKLKYSRGELSAIVKKKISGLFDQDIQIWLLGVQLALEEFAEHNQIPARILLCGGASLLPGIKKSLESEIWRQNFSFNQPPKVNFINPEDIDNIKDVTGQLTDSKDITPLALASLALDLIQEENHLIKSILRRTIRLIQN